MMYTKEVMEHFKNPHNMGKLEDYNAVGKVGNPTCVQPLQRIHKNSQSVEIFSLKKGNKVFTHNGYYETILVASKRKYKGKLITFKNKLGKISVTPEHLIYAIKRSFETDYYKKNKNKKELNPAWYHAEDLNKNDIILYPIFKEEKDQESVVLDIPKPKWDFKSHNLPKKLPINSELLRLFGYFLANGHISERKCNHHISLSFHIKETNLVDDVKHIIKNLFNFEVKVKKEKDKNLIRIYIYSARLSRFFKKLFGKGIANKKIPNFIMGLPPQKQKSLLYGLWMGDGCISLNRKGPRANYVTVSYQLAQQIKTLLIRQRIVPSIYIDREKTDKKGTKHKEAYRIHIGQRESLKKIAKILQFEYKLELRPYKCIESWFDKSYLYTNITKKEISNYDGFVNNLEVENAHSFVSDAFTLHNCGDMMYIYLKMEDNIVKDASFETFGCVAALATSSVATDLVKGKTIEEAEKITSKDIIKALGNLPPIKIHCSLLAIDGIKAAIKDFKAKNKQ